MSGPLEAAFLGADRADPQRRVVRLSLQLLHVVKQQKALFAGGALVAVVTLMALLAPILSPYDPNELHPVNRLAAPGSMGYLLGTDGQGRDITSRLLWGSRTSLAIAVIPLGVAGVVGIILGSIAGHAGRLAESLIMRAMDILFGIPPILLAIAIAATLTPGLWNLIISLTIVLIPPMTRVTQQVALVLREQTFVEAARASGAKPHQIVLDHVVPNSLAPILAYATSLAGAIVVAGAGLSFIGLGIQPPEADWGRMMNDGREVLDLAPHVATLPGLAIFVLALGFNLLGDSLRDVLDPHLRAAAD